MTTKAHIYAALQAAADAGEDDSVLQELARRYHAAPEETKPASFMDKAGDAMLSLAVGGNQALAAIPNLIAPEGDIAKSLERGRKDIESLYSDDYRAANAALEQKIKDEGGGIMATASGYLQNPGQAGHLMLKQLPSMAPGAAAAKIGLGAAGLTNAAMNAGGARGDAYAELLKKYTDMGMSPEEASAKALEDSRYSAAVGGAVGAVTGRTGLEKAIAGGAKGRVAAAGAELLGEQAEELLPQATTNVVAGNPITQGLGRTAVETLIGSAPGSAGAAVLGKAPTPTGEPSPGGFEPSNFTGDTPGTTTAAPTNPGETVPTQPGQITPMGESWTEGHSPDTWQVDENGMPVDRARTDEYNQAIAQIEMDTNPLFRQAERAQEMAEEGLFAKNAGDQSWVGNWEEQIQQIKEQAGPIRNGEWIQPPLFDSEPEQIALQEAHLIAQRQVADQPPAENASPPLDETKSPSFSEKVATMGRTLREFVKNGGSDITEWISERTAELMGRNAGTLKETSFGTPVGTFGTKRAQANLALIMLDYEPNTEIKTAGWDDPTRKVTSVALGKKKGDARAVTKRRQVLADISMLADDKNFVRRSPTGKQGINEVMQLTQFIAHKYPSLFSLAKSIRFMSGKGFVSYINDAAALMKSLEQSMLNEEIAAGKITISQYAKSGDYQRFLRTKAREKAIVMTLNKHPHMRHIFVKNPNGTLSLSEPWKHNVIKSVNKAFSDPTGTISRIGWNGFQYRGHVVYDIDDFVPHFESRTKTFDKASYARLAQLIVHELTHAYQDQRMGLKSATKSKWRDPATNDIAYDLWKESSKVPKQYAARESKGSAWELRWEEQMAEEWGISAFKYVLNYEDKSRGIEKYSLFSPGVAKNSATRAEVPLGPNTLVVDKTGKVYRLGDKERGLWRTGSYDAQVMFDVWGVYDWRQRAPGIDLAADFNDYVAPSANATAVVSAAVKFKNAIATESPRPAKGTFSFLEAAQETTDRFLMRIASTVNLGTKDIASRIGISSASFRSSTPLLRNLNELSYQVAFHIDQRLKAAVATAHSNIAKHESAFQTLEKYYGNHKFVNYLSNTWKRGTLKAEFAKDMKILLEFERDPSTWFNNVDWYPSNEQLRAAGMSEGSILAWRPVLQAYDAAWEHLQNAAKARGIHVPERIPGYMPHKFPGSYSVQLYKLGANAEPIYQAEFAAPTKAELDKIIARINKTGLPQGIYMEIKHPSPVGNETAAMMMGLVRAKDRTENPGLSALVTAIQQSMAQGIIGSALERQAHPKRGHILDRLAQGENLNYSEGLHTIRKAFNDIMEWNERVGFVNDTLIPLEANGLMEQPNLRRAIEDYMHAYLDLPRGVLEKLDVKIRDTLIRHGMNPSVAGTLTGNFTKATSMMYLMANVPFYIANSMQFVISLPALHLAKARMELTGDKVGSISSAVYHGTKRASVANQKALEWAKLNGYVDPVFTEQLLHSDTGGVFDRVNDSVSLGIEQFTRSQAFLYGYNLYKQTMEDKAALEMAGEFANMVSVPYGAKHGAPVILRQLPQALRPLAMFATYQIHMLGMINQMVHTGIQGIKAKDARVTAQSATSLATFVGLGLAMFGLAGAPWVKAYDDLMRITNAAGWTDMPLVTELARTFDNSLGLDGLLEFGTISKGLGYDVSTSGSGVSPAIPTAGLRGVEIAAHGAFLSGKWAWGELSGHQKVTKQAAWDYAKTLPKSFQGPAEYLIRNEKLFGTSVLADPLMPGRKRTEMDKAMRALLGLKSVDEQAQLNTDRIVAQHEAALQKRITSLGRRLKESAPNISRQDEQELVELAKEYGVMPMALLQGMIQYQLQTSVDPDQKMALNLKPTPQSLLKYQRFKERQRQEPFKP